MPQALQRPDRKRHGSLKLGISNMGGGHFLANQQLEGRGEHETAQRSRYYSKERMASGPSHPDEFLSPMAISLPALSR